MNVSETNVEYITLINLDTNHYSLYLQSNFYILLNITYSYPNIKEDMTCFIKK